MHIPDKLKVDCLEMYKEHDLRYIYDNLFSIEHPGMQYSSFTRQMLKWRAQNWADSTTLNAGTYQGFAPYGATVQVNGKGDITQAWIKQSINDGIDRVIEAIQDGIEPIEIEQNSTSVVSSRMLEIPLFDMHFGVAYLTHYRNVQSDIIGIIKSQSWDEVNILIGQDLIHNNDLRGHTAKGTQIDKVDIRGAWKDAWCFWCPIIEESLRCSKKVNVRYSKGNHDECISWCFLKALEARYPQLVVDDSFNPRKLLLWKQCFIGYGHCEYTGNLQKIFHDFVIDFAKEFANAKVREIHTGHLHRESVDEGVMVRRLATAKPSDTWHDENGYIGSHRRFQIFEWLPDRLSVIHYVE